MKKFQQIPWKVLKQNQKRMFSINLEMNGLKERICQVNSKEKVPTITG